MALPSGKRPILRQKEKELEEAEVKKEELKVIVKKEKLFMKCMIEWYKKQLSPKEKRELTRKKLLRRALFEAHRIKFPIRNVSDDWLGTLRRDHGIVLYKKVKKSKSNIKIERATRRIKITAARESTPEEVSSPPVKNGTADLEPQPCSSASMTMAVKKSTNQPKREVKKLIDLSNEPPPGWWLQSYAKGIVLQRKLLLHSNDDQNIIFYDYTQNPKDVVKTPDGTFVGRVHDKDGVQNKFDWWAGQMEKEKEAEERRNFNAEVANGYVWPR